MNRRNFLKLALSTGAVVLTGSYPILIERNIVLVNHYQIPIHNLPPAFQGFRLAQLTDIHLGFLVSANFVEGLIHRTNRLGVDVIVCTGDFVHAQNTREEIDQIWPLLGKLDAPYGVYSVLGNHDHWADTDRSLYWLERSGQNLRHQTKALYKGKQRIILGGCGDYWTDDINIDSTFNHTDEQDCRILLAHNPDTMDTEFQTPIALMISGHTHGGQVVLPLWGAIKLPVANKDYSSGLIHTHKAPLFISRGIGWAILPVRFNCYPEIAVLHLANPALTV